MESKKLVSGQKIPSFKTEDIRGNVVSSDQLGSQKWLFSFFRYAECSLCNLRIAEIMSKQEKFKEANIQFVAIFQSSPEQLHSSVSERHFEKFCLIADPEKELYDLFGVSPSWLKMFNTISINGVKKVIQANKIGFKPGGNVEGNFNQIPADFLVFPDKTISIAHYGNSVIDHLPLDQLWV